MSEREASFDYGRCHVVKLGYSSKPWRIVEKETGRELWVHDGFNHPDLGLITIPAPLAFDRRREALAALSSLTAEAA